MVDPVINQIITDLEARKANLETEHGDAQTLLDGIEQQLHEVNDAWLRLTGDKPAPAPAAKPQPQEPGTPRPKAQRQPRRVSRQSAARQKALISAVREWLPQDGEWHEFTALREHLLSLSNEYMMHKVLKTLPLERKSSGHGKPWLIRWKPDARQQAPVTETQIRDFILAHKDGFTREGLAAEFGRTYSWTTKALEPFFQKGMLAAQGQGHKVPDLLVYQPPQASPTPPASRDGAREGARASNRGVVPGTARMSDLPRNKEMADLVRKAKAQGCRVSRTGNDHFLIQALNGRTVTVSGTPKGQYAAAQAKRDLIKIGIRL